MTKITIIVLSEKLLATSHHNNLVDNISTND